MSTNDSFQNGGLTINVTRGAHCAHIVWKGQSDCRDPTQALGPFLSRLVRELKGLVVTVNFTHLEYMNSATVAPLVQFVKQLDAAGIPTSVIFDLSVGWQKTNYICMKTIARTLSSVQIQGQEPPSSQNRLRVESR